MGPTNKLLGQAFYYETTKRKEGARKEQANGWDGEEQFSMCRRTMGMRTHMSLTWWEWKERAMREKNVGTLIAAIHQWSLSAKPQNTNSAPEKIWWDATKHEWNCERNEDGDSRWDSLVMIAPNSGLFRAWVKLRLKWMAFEETRIYWFSECVAKLTSSPRKCNRKSALTTSGIMIRACFLI